MGVLPAVLIVFVRLWIAEPVTWSRTKASGSLQELLSHPTWRRRALLGLFLAMVGLGTFWGVTVAGQNLAERMLLRQQVTTLQAAPIITSALGQAGGLPGLWQAGWVAETMLKATQAKEPAKFAYGIVETAGGGLGLLAFGPLAARLGRRQSFLLMLLGSLIVVPVTCYAPANYEQLLALLPVYGFFTVGFHAGFAVWFPELFPTHLRATGAGFCFNGGRLAAVSVLYFSGWLKSTIELPLAITLLSLLFLPGILLIYLLPETKGQPLPE